MIKHKGPKVLYFDIETAPILGYVWGLWENNLGLNQIKSDWHLLSFSAKWAHSPKVIYFDQSKAKNMENDKDLLTKIWKLLDEADIVVGQNSISFDSKKLNARFVLNGLGPPSPYKHIDTLRIAKKKFGFTSNKLEYMTSKLNTKYKKLTHAKFSGFELWKQCLAGNKAAWAEMKKYNMHDVLSLEELYVKHLQKWDNTINFNGYHNDNTIACNCGSTEFERRGYAFTATGKFQQYKCASCGAWYRGKENLHSKDKKSSFRVGI